MYWKEKTKTSRRDAFVSKEQQFCPLFTALYKLEMAHQTVQANYYSVSKL